MRRKAKATVKAKPVRKKKRKPGVYLNEKQKAQLRKAYKARKKSDLTGQDIADTFGITMTTLHNHLKG